MLFCASNDGVVLLLVIEKRRCFCRSRSGLPHCHLGVHLLATPAKNLSSQAEMSDGGGIFLSDKALWRWNTLCISRKSNAVWRE